MHIVHVSVNHPEGFQHVCFLQTFSKFPARITEKFSQRTSVLILPHRILARKYKLLQHTQKRPCYCISRPNKRRVTKNRRKTFKIEIPPITYRSSCKQRFYGRTNFFFTANTGTTLRITDYDVTFTIHYRILSNIHRLIGRTKCEVCIKQRIRSLATPMLEDCFHVVRD